jgi:UDP-3-O-[3-hydroxymyristoyl] glucosamine N-acyltransferase
VDQAAGGLVSARPGIAASAVVESERIGDGVSIGEFAIVRAGAEIGDQVTIHPHAIVEDGVSLADGVEVCAGAVLGKEPSFVGPITRRSDGVPRVVRIGSGCSVGVHAVVYFDVVVGPDTLIGDGAGIRERSRVGAGCIVGRYVTLAFEVTIGDGSRIMGETHITGRTTIGREVFIGQGVATANDQSFGRAEDLEAAVRGPTIEDRAMIGGEAMLLPGVVIGRDALVAAGAVVTRNVEPGTRVMGVPARPVPD